MGRGSESCSQLFKQRRSADLSLQSSSILDRSVSGIAKVLTRFQAEQRRKEVMVPLKGALCSPDQEASPWEHFNPADGDVRSLVFDEGSFIKRVEAGG